MPTSREGHGEVAIEGRGVAKRFGHVEALTDAHIAVRRGEVVALLGDNGAGKSTFVDVLLGATTPDAGTVAVDGQPVVLRSVRDSQDLGIEAVAQDAALGHDLSVADNLFLGREVLHGGVRGRLGVLDRATMAARAEEILAQLGIVVPSLRSPVRHLSGGQRQAVSVGRALLWARTAMLADEPTAALGARQADLVTGLLRAVADRGLGVLLVSHDLPRTLAVADRAVVLWRGRTVLDKPAAAVTVPELVQTMVGYGQGRSA